MPTLYKCTNFNNCKKENDLKPSSKKNKKFNFEQYTKNTKKSLNEVEVFLRNLSDFSKYIKLYKILR